LPKIGDLDTMAGEFSIGFCQRLAELNRKAPKVAYDQEKGIRVLKAEIFKLSDWRVKNC
jgi:hypothetical protein